MKNTVELLGVYGGDIIHAQSAWTSTNRELTEEKKGRVKKLLKQLADNGHETPFEKSSLHFLCTTEIATHIQLIKHRIGVSINAESARYKELKEDKAYVPPDWPEAMKESLMERNRQAQQHYHAAISYLTGKGFDKKRAKESARFFLPYANQITSDVMFNFRSFVHFLRLRYSKHAQLEIRELAFDMLVLVQQTHAFDDSLEAFGFLRRGELVAPSE